MNIAITLGFRYYKEILIGTLLLFVLIFVIFFNPPSNDFNDISQLSPLVQQYEPIVRKFAKEQGIEQYVWVLLAILQQESGGRGGDVMQSSESQGHPPGYFQDAELSIRYGVLHFKNALTKAKGDIKLALQAYNFGTHFIDYVMQSGGKFTLSLVKSFSSQKAKALGWSTYGDVDYVEHVMRYCSALTTANNYGFIPPLRTIQITSGFGYRFDPFGRGGSYFHKGVDLSCNGNPMPVYAVKPGIVTRAGWESPGNPRIGYGQRVYIDHGGGQTTIYGHLSFIGVKEGQRIGQGQQLGISGTTGSSTGIHLHLELHINGVAVDPTPYILRKRG